MADTKYGNHFIEYDPKQWPSPPPVAGVKDNRPTIAQINNQIAQGAFFYRVHWMLPGGEPEEIGHPPHIHKKAELLFHIGTNPNDPTDLGAEVEMFMGEELEKHTFNRSTVVWIPAGLVNSPWTPVSHKPWLIIEVHQGPAHSYQGHEYLLSGETEERYK